MLFVSFNNVDLYYIHSACCYTYIDTCLIILALSTSAAFSSSPSYQDLKAMVIAFGVVLFILLFLLVLAVVAAALLYASELCIHTEVHIYYNCTKLSPPIIICFCVLPAVSTLFPRPSCMNIHFSQCSVSVTIHLCM